MSSDGSSIGSITTYESAYDIMERWFFSEHLNLWSAQDNLTQEENTQKIEDYKMKMLGMNQFFKDCNALMLEAKELVPSLKDRGLELAVSDCIEAFEKCKKAQFNQILRDLSKSQEKSQAYLDEYMINQIRRITKHLQKDLENLRAIEADPIATEIPDERKDLLKMDVSNREILKEEIISELSVFNSILQDIEDRRLIQDPEDRLRAKIDKQEDVVEDSTGLPLLQSLNRIFENPVLQQIVVRCEIVAKKRFGINCALRLASQLAQEIKPKKGLAMPKRDLEPILDRLSQWITTKEKGFHIYLNPTFSITYNQ